MSANLLSLGIADYVKSIDDRREPFEARATRAVAKAFSKERATLVEAIKTCPSPSIVVPWIGAVVTRQRPAWEAVLAGIYGETSIAFAKDQIRDLVPRKASLGEMVDVAVQWVSTWLSSEAGKRVVGITETTRIEVGKALKAGLDAGEGIPDLAKRIDELYLKQIIPNRSVVIARTEVISASNLGDLAGAIGTGLDLRKEWIATSDKRTRQSHAAADGQTVDLREAFTVGGHRLMFPGDTSHGAPAGQIIGCRCAIGFAPLEER